MFLTSVVVTDLFSLANQCPSEAIRPHTDQSAGRTHWFHFSLKNYFFITPFWKSATNREHKTSKERPCCRKNLARKLIWPLWSSHIFTQWGWLILFSPDHFPGQHKNGKSRPNYLFLKTFRAGRTYFLSTPFIAAESQYHKESRLIYGPFESTLLDQGFPDGHELDACNLPLTGTLLCRL